MHADMEHCMAKSNQRSHSRVNSMSTTTYYLMALFLAAVLARQLVSGRALGTWWRADVTRQDEPGFYWTFIGLQCLVLVAFLLKGSGWHVR